MPILSIAPRRLMLAFLLAAGLAGCASQPSSELRQLPQRVELSSVPFFRGNADQSAPMALAALLSQQGVRVTPGLLGLPKQAEKLQAGVETTARQYGMLVYPLDHSLAALLSQVAAGYPVLVRFQEGSAFWSEPRYGLLVGFDRYKQRVLLRAGNSRRLLMDFDAFESAWKKEGSWAVLVQQPRQLPAGVDRQRWLKAANDLAQAGQEQAARQAVEAIGR
ncbi:peptidase C39 family protein [Pseudomonas sp. NyZ201]|uniref:peptidase C39 family protein n=1 Tax=Pseudomonas sp. NyZ201 TaxID=3409857 RepID=UPI003CEE0FAE